MAIIFDDKKSIEEYLKEPEHHPESFAEMCRRHAAGLKLVSDEMEQDAREQEELRELNKKRFNRKKELLYENLDIILRHRDEILATPRYANIDVHFAIEGGGCFIGPVSTSRGYNVAGASVAVNLSLGGLLEIWDTDPFKVECKCGGTAVIRYFAGSPLSGSSVATSVCPCCKKVNHRIRNRPFFGYFLAVRSKMDELVERAAKDFMVKWTLAETAYQKKVTEGKTRNPAVGGELRSDEQPCSLEAMVNELRLKEFEASSGKA